MQCSLVIKAVVNGEVVVIMAIVNREGDHPQAETLDNDTVVQLNEEENFIPATESHIQSSTDELDVNTDAPQRRSVRNKVLAGVLAFGVVGGAIAAVMSRGGEETGSDRVEATTPSTASDIEPSSQSTADNDNDEAPNEGDLSTEKPSHLVDADPYTPVAMTSSDPEVLMQEFEHNVECMYNGATSTQAACLRSILGNVEGDLTTIYRGHIASINKYRASNPLFTFDFNYEYLDSRKADDRIVVAARVNDPSGTTFTKRYHFTQPEDNSTSGYILIEEETLSENDPLFKD